MNWSAIKHFTPLEFACKHCGDRGIDLAFVAKLDALRARLGFPMPVTSGYRCPIHNQAVSSTGPNGPHTTGQAADIGISGARARALVAAAIIDGFTGIGINQKGAGRFIHLDTLAEPNHRPRPHIWSY